MALYGIFLMSLDGHCVAPSSSKTRAFFFFPPALAQQKGSAMRVKIEQWEKRADMTVG